MPSQRNPLQGKLNRFATEVTNEDANPHLMKIAGLADKEGERVIAKPISIDEIHPDPLQPRRAIPSSVRKLYDYIGQPDKVVNVLTAWQGVAQKAGVIRLDVPAMLNTGIPPDLFAHWEDMDGQPPAVLVSYVELVKLALSIREDGLLQPISIAERAKDGGYLVILGERRLLAHHLLNMYVDGQKFSKILAIVKPYDVWAQSAENGVRQDLNAVQTARQVCRLIMELHWRPNQFDEFEAMVLPGESDRRYWGQVANGNTYPLSADHYERIFSHTQLSSKAQISQYRRIVRDLTDEEWAQAEEEGWSERAIRDYIQGKNYTPQGETRLTTVNPTAHEGSVLTDDEVAIIQAENPMESRRVYADEWDDEPPTPQPPTSNPVHMRNLPGHQTPTHVNAGNEHEPTVQVDPMDKTYANRDMSNLIHMLGDLALMAGRLMPDDADYWDNASDSIREWAKMTPRRLAYITEKEDHPQATLIVMADDATQQARRLITDLVNTFDAFQKSIIEQVE